MNPELTASHQFCARLARTEARNFYPSFLLLPADRRRAMCALYAFLRASDDIADAPGANPVERRVTLDAWRNDLGASVAGLPVSRAWPGWLALADTVERYGVPTRYLHEVLDGVAMDLEPKPFATIDDLRGYCDRVASAVGLCCLHLWGFESDGGRAEAMARSCGQALQLTNILRDVGEDARNGRVYLPQDDLARFEVDPALLAQPGPTPDPVRRLLAFEAQRAYDEYERARPLARLVSPVGRPVLDAIVGIYRALLDEIARRDYDVGRGRVSLPAWRKAAITVRAFAGRFAPFEFRGVEARPFR